jgi:hypothetical protein
VSHWHPAEFLKLFNLSLNVVVLELCLSLITKIKKSHLGPTFKVKKKLHVKEAITKSRMRFRNCYGDALLKSQYSASGGRRIQECSRPA